MANCSRNFSGLKLFLLHLRIISRAEFSDLTLEIIANVGKWSVRSYINMPLDTRFCLSVVYMWSKMACVESVILFGELIKHLHEQFIKVSTYLQI